MGKGTFMNDLVRGDPFASMRRQEDKMQDAIRQEQERITAEMEKRKKEEEDAKISLATSQNKRAVQRAARGNYSRSTILTSPLGVLGNDNGAGKTLLGQ